MGSTSFAERAWRRQAWLREPCCPSGSLPESGPWGRDRDKAGQESRDARFRSIGHAERNLKSAVRPGSIAEAHGGQSIKPASAPIRARQEQAAPDQSIIAALRMQTIVACAGSRPGCGCGEAYRTGSAASRRRTLSPRIRRPRPRALRSSADRHSTSRADGRSISAPRRDRPENHTIAASPRS